MITAFRYPDGGAAAVRHQALAAGLAANGHHVTFVLLRHLVHAELASATAPSTCWVSLSKRKVSSRIGWRFSTVRRLRELLGAVARSHAIDGLLVVGLDSTIHAVSLSAAKSLGVPVLHELTEFPDVILTSGAFSLLNREIYLRRHLRAFSGVLVISTALQQYVAGFTNAPALLLGALLDLPNHPPMRPLELSDTLTIGYAGALSEAKDGVLTLLRAVAAAGHDPPNRISIRLVMVGNTDVLDGPQAVRDADRLGIADRVSFSGQVPHRDVRRLLSQCHVLALPRPRSRQALGGFPTKLAEYLSTARPVIVTRVGDIPRFLSDRDSCIMADPGSVESLVRCILAVAADYRAAQAVGSRGRAVAEESFATARQAPRLADFVEGVRVPPVR